MVLPVLSEHQVALGPVLAGGDGRSPESRRNELQGERDALAGQPVLFFGCLCAAEPVAMGAGGLMGESENLPPRYLELLGYALRAWKARKAGALASRAVERVLGDLSGCLLVCET